MSSPIYGSTAERRASPRHTCHAIGCSVDVPEKHLMCMRHWFMVPKNIREQVWATYRPGQEKEKNPTQAWMSGAKAAIQSVRQQEMEKIYAEL